MIKFMNKIKESAAVVITIVTLISIVFGVYFYNEKRYALAAELNLVAERLDQKISEDRSNNLQQRIWKIEDKYGNEKKMPKEIKDEYRQLKNEKESIDRRLNKGDKK